MALDGLVISNIVYELDTALAGGHINKIYQPEADALLLGIKNNRKNYKLLISASASLPLIYLTDETPDNPMSAPNFCMLLRKYIGGGRITGVTQPGLERIIHIHIEHLDELGYLRAKILIVELMCKYSNIIFCQPDLTIIDSIKHISANISSVREVLPGRTYFIADTQKKQDPFLISQEDFTGQPVLMKPMPIAKAIYTSITGISPIIAEEICCRAGIDSARSTSSLTDDEKLHLYGTFERLMDQVTGHDYRPNIVSRDGVPEEFSCTRLTCYAELDEQVYDSISDVLKNYYALKNKITRIRQKSSDLRHITGTALDRCRRKYAIQQKQMKGTEKRDKYRIYGEMINTYGYGLPVGAKVLECVNYYDGKEIKVPLDPTMTPHENSVRYFNRYAKLKRTREALTEQIADTQAEIEHLESIQTALNIASDEAGLSQVKDELTEYGYIKKHAGGGRGKARKRIKSKPFHYISSDGFHMYVGKNNYQNEELTFSVADGADWWFHAKGIPGSHVIVKTEGKELPDRTFEEAGRLAAYYSKGQENDKVEVDYIQKKYVKKTPGGRPGFVIYHTNYSMVSRTDISGIRQEE